MLTQLTVVVIASGLIAVAALARWRRARRLRLENPQARYRKDIQALNRRNRFATTRSDTPDIWSSGAASGSPYSKSKKAAAWVGLGAVGGCGGCGGCGCGG